MDRSSGQICVVGIGAHTPVGLNAMSTAAAVRAGISGLCQHATIVDHAGDPFRVAMDQDLCEQGRDARMLQLAANALSEVLVCAPRRSRPRRTPRHPPYDAACR